VSDVTPAKSSLYPERNWAREQQIERDILSLCCMKKDAPVSAYAGILTARTSTTGAERSARFVRTARVGGQVSGRSCAPSSG
jgi:hypothetical protein